MILLLLFFIIAYVLFVLTIRSIASSYGNDSAILFFYSAIVVFQITIGILIFLILGWFSAVWPVVFAVLYFIYLFYFWKSSIS